MKRYLTACTWLLALLTMAPVYASPKVFSLFAHGTLQIDPEGKVLAHTLHESTAPAVRELISRSVQSWRFEPIRVDGVAVHAKTRMDIVLEALPLPEQKYQLRFAQLWFGGARTITKGGLVPPRYPEAALRAGIGAETLVAVKIGADGVPLQAHAVRTSLSVRAGDKVAEKWRKVFAKASVDVAMRWRFESEESINGEPVETTVLVPLAYSANSAPASATAFVPGPVKLVPWLDSTVEAMSAATVGMADRITAGGRGLQSRFKLLEPVVGRSL